MKVKIGLRGNSDSVSAIIIKLDDLALVTSDNLFFVGEENRNKIGANIIKLLDALSADHDIEIGDKIIPMIEQELNMKEGTLNKYSSE